ncbi:phosphatase PAP2 family protein [Frankia sp. AgB1.9]|uniref:phosphatase PAP2 family protein n=1 Tax=unclassified Frankia TaxID=2632575 RepID=UPI001932E9B3|nr:MULTISPECIES: phosphatase PAP2 family protein [unclassified Frankia]MBL7489941.1 phosphatase PAP2 family protein [Frankia sp. AgW1.1]MBL7552672.1 phosphatase PAP2 family protein [Frankia sp. AgB1.9]MBL7623837.1 phosphatase PAP2 family protein [Frankia sp. AgB1.8]
MAVQREERHPGRGPRRRWAAVRRYPENHPDRMTIVALVGLCIFLAVGYLAPRLRLARSDLDTPDFHAAGATALAFAAAIGIDLLLVAGFAVHDRAARLGGHHTADPQALLSPALRPFGWLVILPILISLATLATHVTDRRGPLPVDQRVDDALAYRLYPLHPVLSVLTQLGGPPAVGVLSALLGVLCLVLRRRRAALLAMAGPALAAAVTEYALKPLIDRRSGPGLAFPSGHTTGAVAVATVIALLLLPAGTFTGLPRAPRILLGTLAAVLASTVPIGLIALRYHYATDTLGGGAVAAIVVLTLALALDTAARPGRVAAVQGRGMRPRPR